MKCEHKCWYATAKRMSRCRFAEEVMLAKKTYRAQIVFDIRVMFLSIYNVITQFSMRVKRQME